MYCMVYCSEGVPCIDWFLSGRERGTIGETQRSYTMYTVNSQTCLRIKPEGTPRYHRENIRKTN